MSQVDRTREKPVSKPEEQECYLALLDGANGSLLSGRTGEQTGSKRQSPDRAETPGKPEKPGGDQLPKNDQIQIDERQQGEALFDRSKISKIAKIVDFTKEGVKLGETMAMPKEGEPLPKGDYKIFWKIGKDPKTGEDIERAALLHVPEGQNLGLLVLEPGVSNKDQLSENYLMETHLRQLADTGNEKYAILTLLTEKREFGTESREKHIKSSGWVAEGCFLHKEEVEKLKQENKERTGVAYDDLDYAAGVLRTATGLVSVDKDRHNFLYVGGSQGGGLITVAAGDSRFNDMQNIVLIGSSAEASSAELNAITKELKLPPLNLPADKFEPFAYKINAGTARNVIIFQHRKDRISLPHPENLGPISLVQSGFLRNPIINMGLGAFDNLHQNPLKLEWIYLRDVDKKIWGKLGANTGDNGVEYTMKASVPTDLLEPAIRKKLHKTRADFVREIKSQPELDKLRKNNDAELLCTYGFTQNSQPVTVDVYQLPANHVITAAKGADPKKESTSTSPKYIYFDEPTTIDEAYEALLVKRKNKLK